MLLGRLHVAHWRDALMRRGMRARQMQAQPGSFGGLRQAVGRFPAVAAAPWPLGDALLVACHSAAPPRRAPAELLRPWAPFAAVWDAFVAAAGAG